MMFKTFGVDRSSRKITSSPSKYSNVPSENLALVLLSGISPME